jgi:hypothetical protein
MITFASCFRMDDKAHGLGEEGGGTLVEHEAGLQYE